MVKVYGKKLIKNGFNKNIFMEKKYLLIKMIKCGLLIIKIIFTMKIL